MKKNFYNGVIQYYRAKQNVQTNIEEKNQNWKILVAPGKNQKSKKHWPFDKAVAPGKKSKT